MPVATTSPAASAVAPRPDGMERLPIAALRVPGVSNVDAYAVTAGASEPKLLWSRSFTLTDEHLVELKARGIHTIWITRPDAERVAQVLAESKSKFLRDDYFTACERFVLMQFTAATELDASFRMVRCTRYVECCQRLGPDLAAALFSAPSSPTELFWCALRGATTATRFPMLAGYACFLAKALGTTDPDRLAEIAVGAMIHDVGLRQLPADAVSKGSRGVPEERDAFERHPQTGYEDLLLIPELVPGQLMMAYQHHERADGGGYPVQVPGDEIHLWAKMLAVVDRFDSLTVGRAHRRAVRIADALDRIKQDASGYLDPEMTKCWVSLMNSN